MHLREMTFCRSSAEDVALLCNFLVCCVPCVLAGFRQFIDVRVHSVSSLRNEVTTSRVIGMKKGKRQTS